MDPRMHGVGPNKLFKDILCYGWKSNFRNENDEYCSSNFGTNCRTGSLNFWIKKGNLSKLDILCFEKSGQNYSHKDSQITRKEEKNGKRGN